MLRVSGKITLGLLAIVSASAAFGDIASANIAYNRGDYAAAAKEYRQLALTGDPVAQFNLGQAYKLGRGVPLDLNQALEWYRKAAEHNPPLVEAQNAYGLLLFQNGKRQEAMPYLQQSADRGDPRAQYVLGTAYFNGDLVAKDPVKAYAYMTRAAASNALPKASEALATMDNYIPLPQREQGQTLAREMELGVQRQQLAQLDPKNSAPTPMRTEQIPASNAAGITFADPSPTPPKMVKAPKPMPIHLPKAKPVEPVVAAAPIAKPAPTVVTASAGRWRVQLGAFGDQGKAQAFSEQLQKEAALSGHPISLVKAGNITRVQAGSLASKAAAAQLCAALKSKNIGCQPVNP